MDNDVGKQWVDTVLVFWLREAGSVKGGFGRCWWIGVWPKCLFDNGEFKGDKWDGDGVPGGSPDSSSELRGGLEVFETYRVRVALQAENLSGGEKPVFVVVKCKKTGKVVSEVEVCGTVAAC